MKLYNFLIIGWLALATASNNTTASDASSSSDPYAEFTTTGFNVRPLKGVTGNTDFLSTETVAELQKFKGAENFGVIVSHPFADGKTIRNYAPFRSTIEASDKLVPFDTIVVSRYASGQLPRILASWVQTGFSSHGILLLDGRFVLWVDPLKCKGQMAGPWNKNALEILAETDGSQSLIGTQIGALAALTAFIQAQGEPIAHLLSHREARGSKEEGTITNIAFVREQLKLSDANKVHDQTPLPVVKADEEKAEAEGKIGGQEKTGSKCAVQ